MRTPLRYLQRRAAVGTPGRDPLSLIYMGSMLEYQMGGCAQLGTILPTRNERSLSPELSCCSTPERLFHLAGYVPRRAAFLPVLSRGLE